MSKGGGGSQPAPPDTAEAVRTQAVVNRVNTYSPFGNATFFGPDRSSLRIDLSPAQQQILGGQQALQQGLLSRGLALQDYLPTDPLNFEGLPGQVTGVDVNAPAANPYEQAMFKRARNLLDPVFAEQQEAINQDLANRGLPVGGEAYGNVMDRFDRARAEAYENAALGAVQGSVDLGFRNAAMQNQARQQGINERSMLRGNQFNEIAAILRGTPVQMPQQQPATPVDALSPMLAGYQGQLNAYNQSQANRQSTLGGLLSLGGSLGAAAIMSDARVKTHVTRLGTHPLGIGVYAFRYTGQPDTHIGVMAQEVERVKPEAVIEIAGVKHVNYEAL